jgi:hypothetical protein
MFLAKYDRALIESATKSFWFRYCGKDVIICILMLSVAGFIWFGMKSHSWITATFLSLSIVFLFILIAIYIVYKKRALKTFEQMGSESVEWCFDDISFSVKSDIGSAEFKWVAIKKLWKFKDVWLMFYANSAYSTLPIKDMPEDIKTYIQKNITAHGGKII